MLEKNWTKTVLSVMLVVLVASAMLAVSCAKPSVPATPAASPAPVAGPSPAKFPDSIALGASSSGASGYAMAVAFSQYAKQELGVSVIVSEVGASGARLKKLIDGDAELANTIPFETLAQAWNGTGIFQGQAKPPVRALMSDLISGITIFSLAKAGIKTFPDMRGKKFACINKATPVYGTCINALLEYHNMKMTDFKAIEFSVTKEATDGVSAGIFDAGIRTAGKNGTVDLIELARTREVNILSLTDDEINYCIKKEPTFSKIAVREGVYAGNKGVQLVGYPAYLVAHSKLSDDFVYAVCKVLLDTAGVDTPSRYAQAHPDRDFTLSDACVKPIFAPYHPGAVKYFKERKVWTDEHEKAQQALLTK